MKIFKDQLNRIIRLPDQMPLRIVSLVPSQTELLFDLGLDEEVKGITKFCIHPENWRKSKPKVGGTKNVNIEAVTALNPTLIIANKEENVKEQIEALERIAPVWVSDINTLEDACEMIEMVGEIVRKPDKAILLARQIREKFSLIPQREVKIPAAYFIWKNPYMAAGNNTFIDEMLNHFGFENIFNTFERYPEVTLQQLEASACRHVFLSSEPYPFKQSHADELQSILPQMQVSLVDGEMFCWYGSRLLPAADYLLNLSENLHHKN